jgi:hypothetical protein
MGVAIKISRQSVIIDSGIEVRRANSTGRKVTETINFNRLVFVGFFVNQAHRWCHEVLALKLQSVLYPQHNPGMQSPRKLDPSDSSNPNNRLHMSSESLEMGRSILLSFSIAPSIALIPRLLLDVVTYCWMSVRQSVLRQRDNFS